MSLVLLHTPAEVLSWLLVQMNQAVSWNAFNADNALAWPVYVGNKPDRPDGLLVIDDTTPMQDGRVMVGGEAIKHPGFTVTVRGATRGECGAKAEEVFRALCEDFYAQLVNVDGRQYVVHSVANMQGPIRIGKETPESRRELATINGVMTLTRST